MPTHASAVSGLGSIIPMNPSSSSPSDPNVDVRADADVPRCWRRWRSMLLMLRVEMDCVLRIEEGEEDREEVVERWKVGGWRDIFILEWENWWERRLG